MKKETRPRTCNILPYAKGSPVQSILKNGPQPTAVSVLRRLVSTTFLRGRAEDRGLWVVAMLRYGEAGARCHLSDSRTQHTQGHLQFSRFFVDGNNGMVVGESETCSLGVRIHYRYGSSTITMLCFFCH